MQTTFIERMKQIWTTRKLKLSEPLIQCWQQMETALQVQGVSPYWQVLQWPTGTGKTMAMAAILSLLPNWIDHPGVLVVTKYREEANKLQNQINLLSGWNQARAFHTGGDNPDSDLAHAPVLIVTHSWYRRALQERSDGTSARYDRITDHQCGKRQWIIIDEAFDWVDAFKVRNADLRIMCADIAGITTPEIRNDLQRLLSVLFELTDMGKVNPNHRLTEEQFRAISRLDLTQLRSDVAALPDHIFAHWEEAQKRTRSDDGHPTDLPVAHSLRDCYLDHLDELQKIKQTGFAWASSRDRKAHLHSSRSLIDAEPVRGIILDATAAVDLRYSLMTEHVRLIPRPQRVRDYSNVRLHVSTGHRVGKEHLGRAAPEQWPVLSMQLADLLGGRPTLICTHKNTASVIKKYEIAHRGRSFTHWGDIDGRNDWSDKSAAVFFGLPYTDNCFAISTFFALAGPQDNSWLRTERRYGVHADISVELGNSFIIRSVVQAINRVRCRRSIDEYGHCEPTDIYLLLPNGRTSDALLHAITEQMPGIALCGWDAASAKRKARAASCKARFLAFMSTARSRTYSKSEVIHELRTNARTFERVITQLLVPTSDLARELASYGAAYHASTGRGHEAYFMKN